VQEESAETEDGSNRKMRVRRHFRDDRCTASLYSSIVDRDEVWSGHSQGCYTLSRFFRTEPSVIGRFDPLGARGLLQLADGRSKQ
jgi:hypothetical protein